MALEGGQMEKQSWAH